MIKISGGTAKQRRYLRPWAETLHRLLLEGGDVVIKLDRLDEVHGTAWMCEDQTLEVELDRRLKLKHLALTLCHEFVHLQQFQQGRLKIGEHYNWRGERYNDTDYWSQPWEREAYARQARVKRLAEYELLQLSA